MYIRSFEGFGLGSVPYSKKYSSRDYMWSDPISRHSFVPAPPHVAALSLERNLKVRFDPVWLTFFARVKRAIGRFTVFRSDKGEFVEDLLMVQRLMTNDKLEKLHSKMRADIANAKDFVVLLAVFFGYRKLPSGTWFVYALDFSQSWRWE